MNSVLAKHTPALLPRSNSKVKTKAKASVDGISIILEGLVNVVRVGDIFGSLLLSRESVPVVQKLFPCDDILLHHFIEENVIDFDVMR